MYFLHYNLYYTILVLESFAQISHLYEHNLDHCGHIKQHPLPYVSLHHFYRFYEACSPLFSSRYLVFQNSTMSPLLLCFIKIKIDETNFIVISAPTLTASEKIHTLGKNCMISLTQ